MSKQLVAAGAAALALAGTTLVVDQSPGGSSTPRPEPNQLVTVRAQSPAATCPRHTPGHIPGNSWILARHVLAPPGPKTIRLCRYSGLNDHPRLVLRRTVTIRAKGLVRQLVDEFDALPSFRGAVACSVDDGSEIVALLAYPAGRAVMISVGLRGCELVTNGSVYRMAATIGSSPISRAQLVAQLERLTAGSPRPRRHVSHP